MSKREQVPALRGARSIRRGGLVHRIRGWIAPAAPWVALLGVDGSGKSTVLRALRPRARRAGFAGLFVIHRRPNFLFPAGASRRGDAIDHYGKPAHAPLLSAVKLGMLWLDWWLGYWLLIRRHRAGGALVISDRHSLLDMPVDPLRYRYGGKTEWVRRVAGRVPMPDGVILLDAPAAVLHARKPELTEEQAAALRRAYRELVGGLSRGAVVDANRPVEQVTADVWNHIQEIAQDSR